MSASGRDAARDGTTHPKTAPSSSRAVWMAASAFSSVRIELSSPAYMRGKLLRGARAATAPGRRGAARESDRAAPSWKAAPLVTSAAASTAVPRVESIAG